MAQLKRMMAAGVWPRERNTTTVAPINPASVNNCQGCSDSCRSVEVSELIVEAGVQCRVRRWAGRGRGGGLTWTRPAAGVDDDDGKSGAGQEVREQPRQTIEGGVLRDVSNVLPVLADERGQNRVVVLAFVDELPDERRLPAVSVAGWPHLAVGERGAHAA